MPDPKKRTRCLFPIFGKAFTLHQPFGQGATSDLRTLIWHSKCAVSARMSVSDRYWSPERAGRNDPIFGVACLLDGNQLPNRMHSKHSRSSGGTQSVASTPPKINSTFLLLIPRTFRTFRKSCVEKSVSKARLRLDHHIAVAFARSVMPQAHEIGSLPQSIRTVLFSATSARIHLVES